MDDFNKGVLSGAMVIILGLLVILGVAYLFGSITVI